ncbi:MAG: hypothetical protein ABL959_06130 [Pyrinomonadaceae bacterium]
MNSALRIALLGIACLAVTAVCLMILNTIITAFAPCYLGGGCAKMPITETIATILDTIRYFCYFAIFPLGAVLRKRDFRKLTASKKLNRFARYAFAAIPFLLLPFRSFLNINLF